MREATYQTDKVIVLASRQFTGGQIVGVTLTTDNAHLSHHLTPAEALDLAAALTKAAEATDG